jgi:cytokinin dehydrogenase
VFEQPLAVLKPGSVRGIGRIIRFARHNGIRIVGRGKSHTVYAQSQVPAGVVIDMSALATIYAIAPDHIIVDAGICWHDLLKATLEQGLMPPVLPDYIGQMVGGTLSVGGIGGRWRRFGHMPPSGSSCALCHCLAGSHSLPICGFSIGNQEVL